MQNIIQKCVYPTLSLCSQVELYFRYDQFTDLDIKNSILKLRSTARVKTNTYFNSVSVGKWKRHTKFKDFIFTISFKGKIKITWNLQQLHFADRILDEIYLESDDMSEFSFPLVFWDSIEDGMLSFDISAIYDSEISSFSYSTSELPTNNIKLGIVITHFNRQQYVLPAIERLKTELLDKQEFKEIVSLYVVDNSQNLPDIDNINIIPNENLGGSGGFSRGLMTLKKNGSYTHCLFMDDDASCEVEGIRRTIKLLQYAKDRGLSVGGAMLREAEMFRQFENGARFDGLCKPNKCGLDLRVPYELLFNEIEEKIDYAGWWFFAFPLSKVRHYAFPYFVRGDDIGFGLVHKFNIITLNGISSWQDDFALKNGPLPYYLDTRNHIMQYFHHLIDGGLKGIFKTTSKMVLRNLLTYHYETALASIKAIEDVVQGNDFWLNNVDMQKKRKELQEIIRNEKIQDISSQIFAQTLSGNPHEYKISRLFRRATLNGHLLPQFCFRKEIVWQHKGFGGHLREVYRYKKVLYIHHPTMKGFILEHSKKQFFSYLLRYMKVMYKLAKNYKSLEKEYISSYNTLTSEEFWKKHFTVNNKYSV